MNPIIFALRRPFTVMVLVVAVILASGLAVYRLPTAIFSNLYVARRHPDAAGVEVPAHVRGAARAHGPGAVRAPPAPVGGPRRAGPAAVVPVAARRGDPRGQRGGLHQPPGQRPQRGREADRA